VLHLLGRRGDGVSCASVDMQAYNPSMALVISKDMVRDGDGIFTCPLGECDDEDRVWKEGNLEEHNCDADESCSRAERGRPLTPGLLPVQRQLPETSSTRFRRQRWRRARRRVRDEDCRGDPDPLPFEDLDKDCVFDTVDNCPCPAEPRRAADRFAIPAPNPDQSCDDFSNPDQADFDGDGLGNVCDPDATTTA
jgi:hypothetical protein